MTLPDGYIGQRVRTRGGSAGTIKVVSTREHMPFYGVQFDEPRLEYLHFTQLVPASEESMTKTIEERVESLEKLITEDKIGSWRRATEAVGGRLTGHDAALNALEAGTRKRIDTIVDDIVAPYCARVRALEERVEFRRPDVSLDGDIAAITSSLNALWRKFDAQRTAAKALRDGPRSYDKRLIDIDKRLGAVEQVGVKTRINALEDFATSRLTGWRRVDGEGLDKRIAALEAAIADRRSANEERLDHSSRLVEQLFTRVVALERRDDDPLRRVHWSSVPYTGTGDDATDDDAPDDPASRDVDSRVDQTAIALRDFTNVALVSELLRRVSPHRSK